MTDILNIISNVQKSQDFLRPNKYEIIIIPPKDLNISNDALQRICLNCNKASLPGKNIATKPSDQGGFISKEIPHSVTYASMGLGFYVSKDEIEKRFFDEWQDLVFDKKARYNLNYYDKYIGTILIRQASSNYWYRLLEVYPSSVSDISLSYDDSDAIGKIDITFNYHSWEKTEV